MAKVLKGADRSDWGKFKVPRSVQRSIPIRRIYQDGTWLAAERFSQTWQFSDINYAVASHDDQLNMFMAYSALLNSLPADAAAKITIANRRIDPKDFERTILISPANDALDKYRLEYNRILTDRAAASNDLIQDKYLTVSTAKGRRPAPSFPGWTRSCPETLQGCPLSPTLWTAPSVCVSSTTFSGPERSNISALT